MPELEIKHINAKVEVKAVEGQSEDTLHIKAYILAFGNVDSYGDIIQPAACDDFLKSENADRLKLCYQHNFDDVIGVITDKGVDSIGMWIEADVLPTTLGKDVQILMKAGAITEFSIGYRADNYSYDDEGHRLLNAITVYEASPVTRAANPKAIVTDMKHEEPKAEPEDLSKLSDEELAARAKAIEDEQYTRIINQLI